MALGRQGERQGDLVLTWKVMPFAHNLERGGMRRTWLRGRENVHKRYLIHVAGHDLGILMRLPIGAATPKEVAARGELRLRSKPQVLWQQAGRGVAVNEALDIDDHPRPMSMRPSYVAEHLCGALGASIV